MSTASKRVIESETVLTAPNLKRLSAFVIDYVVVLVGLIAVFSLSRSLIDLETASTTTQIVFYLFLIALSIAYFTLIPIYFFKGDRVGQTVGKRIMGLKTIHINGTEVTLWTLLIRSLFKLVGEGMLIITSLYFLEVLVLLNVPMQLINYLGTLYIMVSVISSAIMIIRPNRRMFHDYVAMTVVILYDQKVSSVV